MTSIRLGTRGSQLALWQAHHVQSLLSKETTIPIELVVIETHGDLDQKNRLAEMGGFGVFTKAIQDALVENRCDIAVHSLKDLPTIPVQGLTLGGVPKRGATGDAFVSKKHASFRDLPSGAIVGTSSLRRRAQILHRRPDLNLIDLRGNVETRLRKLREQNLDAIVLAQAGLERLGLGSEIVEILDSDWMLPAVGQGAIGLECRSNDATILQLLRAVTHQDTFLSIVAEREMLLSLGGGCLVPIGALSRMDRSTLHLTGVVLSADGQRLVKASHSGNLKEPEQIGAELAEQMIRTGAGQILRTL